MPQSGSEKVEAFSRDIAVVATAQAESTRDCQPIGVRCREALIALADAVRDPARHSPPGAIEPSEADAEERLNAYVQEFALDDGLGNGEARAREPLDILRQNA